MNGLEIGDLFKFDKMVAPTVLRVVYWLGLIGIVLACLMSIFGAIHMRSYSATTGLGTLLVAIIALAFGPLVWRSIISIYMAIFRINNRSDTHPSELQSQHGISHAIS